MKKGTVLIGLVLSVFVSAQTPPKVGNQRADAYIEQLSQQGWTIEGASLSYDGQTLYMSICKPPRTVYDLYSCTFAQGQWQLPKRINELSTETDEWSPSISSDEQTIYFIRRDVVGAGTHKEMTGNMIYCAQRQTDGTWQQPEWMLISNGQDSQLHIYPDNRLLTFYSKGRDKESSGKKDQPRCYYVQKTDKYNWTLPQPLTGPAEDVMVPVKTLTGRVIDHKTGMPMPAQTDVYDALTQQLLSRHTTDEFGTFRLALPGDQSYRIEVSQQGYSKAYIRPTSDESNEHIDVELTPELTLNIRVFDKDELTPLSYHMSVIDSQTKKATAIDADRHRSPLRLAIGRNYILQLKRQGYADTTYLFDTRRDVLVTETNIDLYMRSGKVKTIFTAFDKETGEPVRARYTLCPYEQEVGDIGIKRVITSDTLLQCAQLYHINVTAEGYLFLDTLFTTLSDEGNQAISVPLIPMKEEAIVQLRNIEFEFNSYLLKEDSYEELKQVAELMRQNPNLCIELSAHTDDIGSAEYNLRLSQKRGESVARFLIEEGIAANRLSSKGYGKTRPLVPNDSEANRAINRRVEFTIVKL